MSINVNVGNIIPTNVVEVGNEISVDQLAAITAADSPSAINPFATASHLHTIANISGLQTAIDGKANLSHTHLISSITGLQTNLDEKASLGHIHEIVQVTGLQADLDGKANTVHSHVIDDVTGLQTALNGKANTTHTQAIGSIIFLQATLDSKANLSHTHVISDVTGLQTALDGKLSASHNHDGVYAKLTGDTFTGDVIRNNGLGQSILGPASLSFSQTGGGGSFVDYGSTRITFADTSIQDTASYSKAQSDAQIATVGTWINTKADLGHTHVINDVTGLQTALDSKMAVTQSWFEFDIGRTFTITDGVLTWDNASTLSQPMSGLNAGNFVFNKKVSFTSVNGAAGLNVGIGGTDTSSTTAGDLWIAPSGSTLNYRDGLGTWRILASRNLSNTFTAPQIVQTPAGTTNAALRVTQLGTGHALVVEDSTTPDATAFIIDQHGRVGIGVTPDATACLRVDSTGIMFPSNTLRNVTSNQYASIGNLPSEGYPHEVILNIDGITFAMPARIL
jgi:hypothetical protein